MCFMLNLRLSSVHELQFILFCTKAHLLSSPLSLIGVYPSLGKLSNYFYAIRAGWLPSRRLEYDVDKWSLVRPDCSQPILR